MKNNNSSIKTVVAVGIGAALFFVLGRFVAIPSPVPNTNISLQYAVLALLAAMYGPVAGGLIGFIGHTLIDLSWGGSPWWSWVIASAFVGVVVGLFSKKLNLQEGEFGKKQVAFFALANIVAHLLAWSWWPPCWILPSTPSPSRRCLHRVHLPQCPTVSPLWWWAACWCWLTPEPSPRRALWIRSDPRMKPGLSICAVRPVGKAFLMNS